MKKQKKIFAAILSTALAVSLAGCTSPGTAETTTAAAETTAAEAAADTTAAAEESTEAAVDSATIEVGVNYSDTDLAAFEEICQAFTDETGIGVDVYAPGSNDYETEMKTRMASGDLPDVWCTHGWSLMRYSEFLTPLNDQPWFDKESESVTSIEADDDGNVYAMALNMSIGGLNYNADVLEAANVDPAGIHTWDDFEEACEAVKAAGYIPIILAGSNVNRTACLFDFTAPTYWTAEGAKYDLSESLLDGSFDFDTYATELYERIVSWVDKGYFNVDKTTLEDDPATQSFAAGEGAFLFTNANKIATAKTYQPDSNFGIIPYPSSTEEGKGVYCIGEGDAFGIWKDTDYFDQSAAFLEYLSRPEVAGKICEVRGSDPTLSDTVVGDSYVLDLFNASKETFGDQAISVKIFDQEFLPSGMWSVMGSSIQLLMESPDDIQSAVDFLKDGYLNLYSAE